MIAKSIFHSNSIFALRPLSDRKNKKNERENMSRFSTARVTKQIFETLTQGHRRRPRVNNKLVRTTIGA